MTANRKDETQLPYAGEQPLPEAEKRLVRGAYERFEIFRQGCAPWHERARKCRKIALLEDEDQDPPGTPPAERAPQLQTLRSTLTHCVADQMDNLPEARLLPERQALGQVAEDLTDAIGHVMERNEYERLHRQRAEDFFVTGTAVTQIVWDEEAGEGGEVALIRWPMEALYWDPMADDLQDGRAVFKASRKPRSWVEDRYPEASPYVGGDAYMASETRLEAMARAGGDEEAVLLLEYWYRRYDRKRGRYAVHMALLAGGSLLAASERDRPEGLYAHGLYPFVLDVYAQAEGVPVGYGMVFEYAQVQRYINRYAQYIDANARASSKLRLLVRRDADIDNEDLTDWNVNVIEGGNIGDQAVRWFQSQPLSGLVNLQMRQFQDDLKQDSGQNQFSRGEGGSGVTAASAIMALQEAGGKTARKHTATLNSGFHRIAGQVLWLISQFYDEDRTLLLTGRAPAPREVRLSRARIYEGGQAASGKPQPTVGPLPPPPYTVRIQIQRRNPLRIQAENEMILQMYQMSASAGEPIPLAAVAEMLSFDGKDKVLALLAGRDERRLLLERLAQENAALREALAGLMPGGGEVGAMLQA